MSRKFFLIRSLLLLSLCLPLASPLALAMPTSHGNLGQGGTAPAGPEPASPKVDTNTITGYARTEDDPVVNALIRAQEFGGSGTVETLTDASGAYTLTVPCRNQLITTWTVSAHVTDTTEPSNVEAPSLPKTTSFTKPNYCDQTKTLSDFVFKITGLPGSILGQVLIQGKPDIVPTFPVTVTATQLSGGQASVSQPIDAGGYFTLTVSTGLYYLVSFEADSTDYHDPISRMGYVDETWDMGVLYLTPALEFATLSGEVQTAEGAPAPNVPVMAVQLEQTWPPVSGASLEAAEATWTDAGGAFTMSVRAGMWWVAVDFGEEGHNYMPHLLGWQTVRTVGPAGTADDILLVVDPADSHILGTLTEEEDGPQADDACGLVATYKTDRPLAMVYDYRRFTEGGFDLPVISGTYSLAIQPNPDIDRLLNALPEPLGIQQAPECAVGKYLAKTRHGVQVGQGVSVPITIPLRVADVTIYGRLVNQDGITVTGVSGQIMGWSQGNWSATEVYTPTGSGYLKASEGTWWLAYHVDPESGYKADPGVAKVTVPPTATEVNVDLPVVFSNAWITGTVLGPDGQPLACSPVTAINLGTPTAGGDSDITDQDGQFTLWLDYGDYLVTAFEPPEGCGENDGETWISPELQRVRLTPYQPIQEVNLQFRAGDATIEGQIQLAETTTMADLPGDFRMPAVVWAATVGGRTRTQVPMSVIGHTGVYTLPALQGQTWTVGAAYLDRDGVTLWITETLVTVDSAAVSLDLTLHQFYSVTAVLMQSVDPDQSFYSELVDRVSAYIPGGALTNSGTMSAGAISPNPAYLSINPYYIITLKLKLFLIMDLFLPPDWAHILPHHSNSLLTDERSGSRTTIASSSPQPPGEVVLISPSYEVSAMDDQGNPVVGELNPPAAIRIPYDEDEVATLGFSEDDVQPLCYSETHGGWGAVDSFVVDQDADEVVIFADHLGTYALIATKVQHQIYLPLVLRGVSSP